MKKAIIFDMDGTLWDSAENVAQSWNIAMEEFGYERTPLTGEDLYRVMGKPMDEIARILFDRVEGEERVRLLEHACQVENDYLREHGGILYPQLQETLKTLGRNYHILIVSNCQSGYIEAFLDHYGFHDLVEDFECYGRNLLQKKDNIRLICERNQIAPSEAVYVGDIQGDYDSATAAGVDFVHAAYGFGTIDADVPRISSLGELPQVMAAF